MFTIIRPISALLLAVFALYAAQAYEPIYDPQADLGAFPLWAAGVSALVGWFFLGGRIGRALWYSVFVAVQAVVLAAIATAGFLAVGDVFERGYRRQYDEVLEAITGYFAIVVDWLGRALVQDFVILLGVGGIGIGVVLHILWRMMERRRNAR
jgi:hypothetical protein